MNWYQMKCRTTTQGIDIVSGYLLSHGITGVMIEDAADFTEFLEDTSVSWDWDYIDDELMKMKECDTAVIFYLPEEMGGMEQLKSIKAGFDQLRAENPAVDLGALTLESDTLEEEDWETSWKKYYHPVRVGKRILICPCWEADTVEKRPDDVQVLLDPGMAFGSGTHETTRLCMQFLEQTLTPNDTLLDVGCGSGILAITGMLLGAKDAVGVDIDELAVKIAKENAALNGMEEQISFVCGDLTEKLSGTYDVICANIVADVLVRLAAGIVPFMHQKTRLVVSGIIADRKDEVFAALEAHGLRKIDEAEEKDWISAIWMLKGANDENDPL